MSLLLRGTTLPSVHAASWQQSLVVTPTPCPDVAKDSANQHRLADSPSGGGTGLETLAQG